MFFREGYRVIRVPELCKIIVPRRAALITAAVLTGVSAVCAAVPDSSYTNFSRHASYLFHFNGVLIHFCIQYPLIILLSVPVFKIIQNDMFRLRLGKNERVCRTAAAAAFVTGLFYTLLKTIVEYSFYSALGGAVNPVIFLTGFALLFLTASMILLLFLTLKALTRGTAWPVFILTILFGADTLTAAVYIPLFPESLMLIAYPLSSAQGFLLNGGVNILFLCGVSVFKVLLALALFKYVTVKIERG